MEPHVSFTHKNMKSDLDSFNERQSAGTPREGNAAEPQQESETGRCPATPCSAAFGGPGVMLEVLPSEYESDGSLRSDTRSGPERDTDAWMDDPIVPIHWDSALECDLVLRDLCKRSPKPVLPEQMKALLERWRSLGRPHPRVFLGKTKPQNHAPLPQGIQ